MENEMELQDSVYTLERVGAALEQLAARMEQMLASGAGVGPIVATVDNGRELELEQRLAEAEATIAALRANTAAAAPSGRKTLPVSMVSLLAKQGVAVESMEAGALDAALGSLSIEQRIAVKSELMRAGLLG
jgi:hypothetical protein